MANLTDKKIKDTYEGLIKTNDNNPITGQVELTDGLGNGTGVSVSTDGRVVATGTVSFDSLRDTTVTKFVDEADGIVNNDNDTTLPTSAAVKDYVDTHVTAQDLDFQGDSGTGDVDLDSETFEITGSNGITTTALNNTLDIDGSTLETSINTNASDISTNASNISTNAANITSNDSDISSLQTDVSTNTSNISTNASNISSNDTDIATNVSNIATNTSGIATNVTNIATNVSNISSNDTDISNLQGDVSTNTGNISTNATNIASNDTDIATNASNIATNTSNISSNDTDIATNASNISTNTSNISSNDTDIAALDVRVTANEGDITTNANNISNNDTDIATNTSNIATNTSGVATNVTNIATNTSNITTNTNNISTNTSNISTNTSDISTNTGNISTNATNISSNDTDIATNASGISTNASGISTNVTNIATNTSDISTNAGNISTNTTNISSNDTDIATNASNISTNTSNISTNTTGIADKVSKSGDTMTGTLTNTSGNVKTVIGGNDMLAFEADSGSTNNKIRVLRSGSGGPQAYIAFEEGTGYTNNKMVFNLATPGSYTENNMLTLSHSNVAAVDTHIDAHKRIIAREGIYLGTSSTTSANYLHDYEEGTYNPEFYHFTSPSNLGTIGQSDASYWINASKYTKIGDIVTISINLEFGFGTTNWPSGGTIYLDNLPFTPRNMLDVKGSWNAGSLDGSYMAGLNGNLGGTGIFTSQKVGFTKVTDSIGQQSSIGGSMHPDTFTYGDGTTSPQVAKLYGHIIYKTNS